MVTAKKTLFIMENKLHDSDRWAWAIYTALRHAPDHTAKQTLWALLTPDQQAGLRLMAKYKPGKNQPDNTADHVPKGPTHDKYGVKL